MGGDIEVAGEPGRGSRFTIVLTRVVPSQPAEDRRDPAEDDRVIAIDR